MRPSADNTIPFRSGLAVAFAAILLSALPGLALATDTGAVANGDWSSAATWTNGMPGAADNAYIGSTYPAGAAATAVVTLSQNSSAGNVYLGEGAAIRVRLNWADLP